MESSPKLAKRPASVESSTSGESFIMEYLQTIEDLADQIDRLISMNREFDSHMHNKTSALITITKLLSTTVDKRLLLSKAEDIAREISRYCDEKLNTATEINKLIQGKTKTVNSSSSDLLILAYVASEKQETKDDVEDEEMPREHSEKIKIPITKRVEKKKRRKLKRTSTTCCEGTAGDDEETDDADESEPLYCLCNRVSYGHMVECSNEACPIEWCHFRCVNIKKAPKGKWYCPKCRSRKPTCLKKELNC